MNGSAQSLPDGFHVRAQPDGTVEISVVANSKPVATSVCSPEQISEITAHLLRASHAAFFQSGKPSLPRDLEKVFTVPVQFWQFGKTKPDNKHAMNLQIGDALVGFEAPESDLRNLGRHFLSTSWRLGTQERSFTLLRRVLGDFFVDLRGLSGVLKARLRASSRRYAMAFSSWVTGRSLRTFRSIEVSPGVVPPRYEPMHRCIYCDAKVYSDNPLIRDFPFGTEHIIAEGLGGSVELPEASCQKCEHATGTVIEGDVLGRTLKALRVFLKLKKSGKGPPPKTVPLDMSINGVERKVDIPIEDLT